jgi:formiminotetrahydrofolate cyclodeaminase
MDYGAYRKAGCVKKFLTTRPEEVEEAVLQAMRNRIEQLTIAKHNAEAPDSDHETLRTDIIKIDEEIRKLMEKLADADTVLFDYIQNRINELHEQKSALERKLQTKARKRKAINTKPLEEPMRVWDKLSVEDKHDVAMAMIDAVYVSDEYGVEVKFSI